MISRHIVIEQRVLGSSRTRTRNLALSLIAGMILSAIPILISSVNPLDVYRETVDSALGSERAIQQTLRATTPLILTALAAAVAFRMGLYTIGAEGQLYIGAIVGSGAALVLGDGHSGWYMIPMVMIAGGLGGAIWALIIAIPRALFGTDEVVGTLMLNFIALHIRNWLIFGGSSFWRDDQSIGFPAGKVVTESAQLLQFWGRADLGIFIAVGLAVALWVVLRYSKLGYEWRVIGDSERAATYAGMSVRRQVVAVLVLSGVFAGIAGASQVSSVTYALEPRAIEALGLGFTGIVVAAVAGMNPRAIIFAAFVVAGVTTSGPSLSRVGVSPATVTVFEGLLLLSVAAGQFFNFFTVRRVVNRSSIAEGAGV